MPPFLSLKIVFSCSSIARCRNSSFGILFIENKSTNLLLVVQPSRKMLMRSLAGQQNGEGRGVVVFSQSHAPPFRHSSGAVSNRCAVLSLSLSLSPSRSHPVPRRRPRASSVAPEKPETLRLQPPHSAQWNANENVGILFAAYFLAHFSAAGVLKTHVKMCELEHGHQPRQHRSHRSSLSDARTPQINPRAKQSTERD